MQGKAAEFVAALVASDCFNSILMQGKVADA